MFISTFKSHFLSLFYFSMFAWPCWAIGTHVITSFDCFYWNKCYDATFWIQTYFICDVCNLQEICCKKLLDFMRLAHKIGRGVCARVCARVHASDLTTPTTSGSPARSFINNPCVRWMGLTAIYRAPRQRCFCLALVTVIPGRWQHHKSTAYSWS